MDTPTPENHPSSLDSRRLSRGREGSDLLEGGGHHFNCSGWGSNPNMYTRESESSLSCQAPETEIFMMVA